MSRRLIETMLERRREWTMGGCCPPNGYERVFDERFARKVARRYARRGLTWTQRRMLDVLATHGIEGATVLEIGSGVGELSLELLRRGAARATCLEVVNTYDREAAALLERHGLGDRATRRVLDIAQQPDEVESADLVLLHRVVCCYPDHERLLAAAGRHAQRAIVFSHPPHNFGTRGLAWAENVGNRVAGQQYRAFVHPTTAMVDTLARQGLSNPVRLRGPFWHVTSLSRAPAAA